MFSELFYALVILCIAMLDLQTDINLIVTLIIIAFIASGTQDIATDIYAILSLKPLERSLGNSMQSAEVLSAHCWVPEFCLLLIIILDGQTY